MKKLKQKSGLTLVETLAALMVLVFLSVGINTAMNSASRVYSGSTYLSESSTLSGILNSTITDLIHQATTIYRPTDAGVVNDGYAENGHFIDADGNRFQEDPNYAFSITMKEVQYAFFESFSQEGDPRQFVRMHYVRPVQVTVESTGELEWHEVKEFLNTGAYPELTIRNFHCEYLEDDGCFHITYQIASISDENKSTPYEFYVRPLNP